ncbi:MAG: SsrA-binding protein SmpB [Flavobacteriales bacterium AspAUS03]
MTKPQVNIQNRKATFEYELLEEYIAGMQLLGTEIKSIRQNKASITESFCQMKDGELYIINMYISKYELGTHANHPPRRERKLLLKRKELLKIERKLKESGLTIIPKILFINEKGYAKLQIFLAKGKKLHDKRESIRKKDIDREYKRVLKYQ